MAGPFRDIALCCPEGRLPLPLPNRLVALLQWAMEAVDSSTAWCRWQPNVNRNSSYLKQARGVFFSCCKGIWCLLPATQPGQVQPYLPRTALVRGQVVKIWAMCLLGQCGWGKEGLILSLYSSTRDALHCDVVKVIQESWYEVLEGWFQCWCHAKLWSYFQGVRFYQVCSFEEKAQGQSQA